jgi:hypothetical protein
VRKGFFMNAEGMWRKLGDMVEPVCRAVLRNVESFYTIDRMEFKGYEFDIIVNGKKQCRTLLGADAFTSAAGLKKFFANHQLTFQGGDVEAMALLDIMSEKANNGGRVYTYPREGFFVMTSPTDPNTQVKCYLTQDTYLCSLKKEDPGYFELRYRAEMASSAYHIDIHKAPDLGEEHIAALHDLFLMNRPEVVADLVGWFVAAHYRSVYLYLFSQFPLLQVYGEAGSGKSKQIEVLAHMHWFVKERVSLKSATSNTSFALHCHASSSTSAPFILDEYKPREMRMQGKGKYETVKDVLKASYIGGEIGGRGTLNKGAENHLGLIQSKATAPIVFIGESIEMETAIIERSVIVNTSKTFFSKDRAERFARLFADPVALSALGRYLVQMGFALKLDAFRTAVENIQARVESTLPSYEDKVKKRPAPRIIFNRVVILHALETLKGILARKFGTEFDEALDTLINARGGASREESKAATIHAMSELSKVMNRVALLSREIDQPHEMKRNRDYLIGDGWIEVKVERAYDVYRRYCASVHDRPLFDNLDAFLHALDTYSPVVDSAVAASEIQAEASDKVMRFDLALLAREQVQTFRT